MPDEIVTEEEIDQDGLDDLIEIPAKDEVQPEKEDAEPITPEGTEEPDPVEADTTTEEPAPDESTEDPTENDNEPVPKTIKFKGKEYSTEDLIGNPKLLENLVTAANQQTHYQDLHGENKERLQKMEQQLQAFQQAQENQRQQVAAEQQQAQQRQNVATPEQVAAAYKPVLDELTKSGWIEEDVAELYPNSAIGILTMRDELFGRLAQLETSVGSFLGEYQQRQQVDSATSVMGQITGYLDGLSKEGEIFAPLSNKETQNEFLSLIRDRLNPPVQLLLQNPEILRDYWVGHNHQALLDSVQKAKQQEKQRITKNRQFSGGEGGGGRPAGGSEKVAKPGEEAGWSDL